MDVSPYLNNPHVSVSKSLLSPKPKENEESSKKFARDNSSEFEYVGLDVLGQGILKWKVRPTEASVRKLHSSFQAVAPGGTRTR